MRTFKIENPKKDFLKCFFKEYGFLSEYILRDSIFSKRTLSDKILLNQKEKCLPVCKRTIKTLFNYILSKVFLICFNKNWKEWRTIRFGNKIKIVTNHDLCISRSPTIEKIIRLDCN
jgi:hypothetical protein